MKGKSSNYSIVEVAFRFGVPASRVHQWIRIDVLESYQFRGWDEPRVTEIAIDLFKHFTGKRESRKWRLARRRQRRMGVANET